ncbi:MAG: hypothetical protein ACP5RW_09135 [bacterium]
MDRDVDFVITIDGEDVTDRVVEWSLRDVDEGMSSARVVVSNVDGSLSVSTGAKLEMRFGYVGDLSDQVELDIRSVHEEFSVNRPRTVVVTAHDVTWMLNGGNVKGDVSEGTGDIGKSIQDIIHKHTGGKGNAKPDPPPQPAANTNNTGKKDMRVMLPPMPAIDAIYHLMRFLPTE